ncbi:MAG: hypothetical protein AAGH76_12785 [Pseudomonadota bacterium]
MPKLRMRTRSARLMTRSMRRCRVTLILLLIQPMAISASELGENVSAYHALGEQVPSVVRDIHRARTPTALALGVGELRGLADKGVDIAAFELGYAYVSGAAGVAIDPVVGQQLLEQAARTENESALLAYGLMLYDGAHVPQDKTRGSALIRRAAELGSRTAMLILADNIHGIAPDLSVAVREAWRKQLKIRGAQTGAGPASRSTLFDRNYAISSALLAHLFATGTFVRRDATLAEALMAHVPSDLQYAAYRSLIRIASNASSMTRNDLAAQRYYELALPLDEQPGALLNSYAWLLATSVDPAVRNGQKAMKLIKRSLRSNPNDAARLDTLAAAYAENGQFELAVATQAKALASLKEYSPFYPDAALRRDAYSQGKPWRE